eukprot:TRINITY_DN445_c0_g1_i1.p1 TRINITY_DN445_c0_g1~~TRINITY_DN445_c0_g1_i1.p1  ORF type:complete len:405 (-),score=108.36 TRINITY_DN445_c0_g1_i1:31-1245(-)
MRRHLLRSSTGVVLKSNVTASYFIAQSKRQYADATLHALQGEKIGTNEYKFTFETKFATHKLPDNGPENSIITTTEEMIKLYTQMQRVRFTENASDALYKKKIIRGFLHLYSGQEAVCIGMEAALTLKDAIITAYRDHAHAITRGHSPRDVIAELCGKATGCSKGKGGSMHMYKADANFFGGNGIVGAQVPVGAGIAFAQKILKNGQVTVALYGDGAANQGQIFEAFNISKLWNLPCIFVCENNKYGMGTEAYRASASTAYYTRGDYIPGIKVDGMDVLAVKAASRYAVDYVKKNGPIVMEMETYRYLGHSMSDPGTSYRTQDEVAEYRKTRDPIAQTRERILVNGMATKDDIKSIDKTIKAEIDDAVQFALDSPFPEAKELYTQILKEDVPVRGVELSNSYHP